MSKRWWEIHAWHVCVSIGDAAIHLQVEVTQADGHAPVYTIHSAVLVDGGKTKGDSKIILGVIDKINARYSFAAGKNFEPPYGTNRTPGLRFDSIVFTHWDDDHYAGLLFLLSDGFTLSNNARGAPLPAGLNTLRNWFCKYKDDAGKPVPTPVMYAKPAAGSDAFNARMISLRKQLLTVIYGAYDMHKHRAGNTGDFGQLIGPSRGKDSNNLPKRHLIWNLGEKDDLAKNSGIAIASLVYAL